MSKVVLNDISSGYSTGLINENFQTLEDYINLYVLNRDGVSPGQANQMEVDLDMNGFAILNTNTDISDPNSLITVEEADVRYVNTTGDTMEGPLSVQPATAGSHPVRRDSLDIEIATLSARDSSIEAGYQAGDASLQDQISDLAPIAAAERPIIQWHDQTINNSITIPDNVNAFSFGPSIAIADGAAVTVGENSSWTIANGEVN